MTLRIGIIGNIPKPYGGVATTCYQQTTQLIAAGNQVSFYDRDRHPEKKPPTGLQKFTVTKTRNLPVALRLVADFIHLWFTKRSFRVFFSHIVQDILRYHWPTRYPSTALRMLLRSLEMIRTFEELNIEILHGHHALHDSWVAQLLAQSYFHCPFVVTVYASEFTMPVHKPWRKMAIDVCNRADAVVCISQYTRDCMLQAGAKPHRAVINYLGVEPAHFADPSPDKIQAVRQRFGISDDCPMILYIGWLIERKGSQILLEALAKITHLPWKTIFVGPDGGMKDVLSARAEALKLQDRVIVSDAIPDDEILALYSLTYSFVFPTISRDEGFGLVALEAMAHGVPVIGSRTGAIPEVVKDHETGMLFTPGDSDDLASCLQKLLDQPKLRNQLGKAAKSRAEQFSWESNVNRLIPTYELVIQNYAKSI